jgi:two-component system C4-dicarboxylate transport response regulator DctD
MKTAELQVLLVADDSELIVSLSQDLMIGLSANLTVSDNIEQACSLAACDGFDVIIACRQLSNECGLTFLSHLAEQEISTAVILIDKSPDSKLILSAMRLGAADVLTTPLDGDRLVESVRAAGQKRREHLQLVARTRRLRRLSSRLVKDRRDLRNRVDLICKDLVTAYQRLAEKVSLPQSESTESSFGVDEK